MNDSAQDLEQLIRQYTQELLRFQKQYAAHMPVQEAPTGAGEGAPISLDTSAGNPPDGGDENAPDDLPPETEPLLREEKESPFPDAREIPGGENGESPDRPLLIANDYDRYPRSSFNNMDGNGISSASDDPPPPENGSATQQEAPPPNNPPANRDMLSDPSAQSPNAFPPSNAPSTPELTDFGQLQVQVFKAKEAVPIENATVTIFLEEDDGTNTPITVTRTNRSGFTPSITVPTVSATLSLEPGHEHPYASYLIQVISPGYFTVEDVHVPVFGGITSVQPVEMLPLPENYQGDTNVVYPESEPSL